MNTITLAILALVALFFYQSGNSFLAFLTMGLLVLLAFTGQQKQAGTIVHGPGGQPYIIQQQAPAWPSKAKFEFRPNYPGDPDGDEWISGKAGQWFLFFGKAVKSLFGLGGGKKH